MAIRRFRGHRCSIRALKQKTAQADDQQPVHLNWLRSWVLGGEATRANISCALPGLALGDKHLLNVGPRRTAFLSRVLESARNCDSAGSRRSTGAGATAEDSSDLSHREQSRYTRKVN